MTTQLAPRKPSATEPIRTSVVRSIEPVDTEDFLLRYARAIVEAHGAEPPKGWLPTSQPSTTEP